MLKMIRKLFFAHWRQFHPITFLGFWKIPFLSRFIALLRLKGLLPVSALQRHAYIVGKSGCGKSYLLSCLALRLTTNWYGRWQHRRSVVILDPHGELALELCQNRYFTRQISNHSAPNASPKLVFLSGQLQSGHQPSLNPFDRTGKQDTPEDREVLAQHLTSTFATMLSRGDVRLTFQMRTLLEPMMQVLLEMSAQGTPKTFRDLQRFTDDRANADLIRRGQDAKRHPKLSYFFHTTFFDPRFAATKFSLNVKLSRFLTSWKFDQLLCRPHRSVDLEHLLNRGTTIVIDASESVLGTEVCEAYGRLLTASILSIAFLRGRSPQKQRIPIFFLIDEASRFMCPEVESILTQARKFGLHLVLANQMSRQGHITSELYEAILGNTAVKIVGNVGVKSKVAMAHEMELAPSELDDLQVGQFVVKVDGHRRKRIALPKCWLPPKYQCSAAQWKRVEQYFLSFHSPVHDLANNSTLSPDAIGKSSTKKPFFGIPSPFLFFLLLL